MFSVALPGFANELEYSHQLKEGLLGWNQFCIRAWYPYLKIDKYSNSLRNLGIELEATKKPAKSMKGMISTGVSVTASYLSLNEELIISEQPLDALQMRIKLSKKRKKLPALLFRPTLKQTIHPKIEGVIILNGISEITLAQKYGPTLYMLLLTSLRKTGLSSGKIKITFWIALNDTFMVMKNSAP